MLYYIQPKKAVEVLFTIRSTSNDLLNEHVVVMRIVSGMKKLLHFSNQLLLVAIYQSVSTHPCILLIKVKSTVEVIYVTFSHDVTYHASEVR